MLDDLQATAERVDSNVSRHDAAIDIEQIRMKLKRSRPDTSRVIRSVSGLSAVAGLEGKSANLLPLVERLFLIRRVLITWNGLWRSQSILRLPLRSCLRPPWPAPSMRPCWRRLGLLPSLETARAHRKAD